MIKKFEAFHDDIDPYNEERWEDERLIDEYLKVVRVFCDKSLYPARIGDVIHSPYSDYFIFTVGNAKFTLFIPMFRDGNNISTGNDAKIRIHGDCNYKEKLVKIDSPEFFLIVKAINNLLNTFTVESLEHRDIDPYNEENWEEVNNDIEIYRDMVINMGAEEVTEIKKYGVKYFDFTWPYPKGIYGDKGRVRFTIESNGPKVWLYLINYYDHPDISNIEMHAPSKASLSYSILRVIEKLPSKIKESNDVEIKRFEDLEKEKKKKEKLAEKEKDKKEKCEEDKHKWGLVKIDMEDPKKPIHYKECKKCGSIKYIKKE